MRELNITDWIPWILAVVVLVALALYIRHWLRARAKREAPINQWVNAHLKYQRGYLSPESAEALMGLEEPSLEALGRYRRERALKAAREIRTQANAILQSIAQDRANVERESKLKKQRLRRLVTKARHAGDLASRYVIISKLWRDRFSLSQTNREWVTQQLLSIVPLMADQLFEQFSAGSAIAHKALTELIDRHYGKSWNGFEESYEYPDNWNDVVARVFENPHLNKFVGLMPHDLIATGDMRLRALRALEDKSLTEVKIVLAYCNDLAPQGPRFMSEVLESIMRSLAEFVVKYHAQSKHPVMTSV